MGNTFVNQDAKKKKNNEESSKDKAARPTSTGFNLRPNEVFEQAKEKTKKKQRVVL